MISVAVASVVGLFGIAWQRSHFLTFSITLFGLVAAFFWLQSPLEQFAQNLLVTDGYAQLGHAIVLVATLAVAIFIYDWQTKTTGIKEEAYILLLLSSLGAMVMLSANHFASLSLGLELLTLPLYALIAYVREDKLSLEASVKYVLLAGLSAAFLVFGMAIVYGQTGVMRIDQLGGALSALSGQRQTIALTGLLIIVTGLAFKIGAVPFHMWIADIYQGSPTPITAFLASVSKAASMMVVYRLLLASQFKSVPEFEWILGGIAIGSMFLGNLLALLQKNIKRLLAFSSIAHVGYMLTVFLADSMAGGQSLLIYLVAYVATTLCTFGLLGILPNDLTGLANRRPFAAAGLTLCFLSLLGMPLTAGFIGKYVIFVAGASSNQWAILMCIVASSAIGLYAYMRVVVGFFRPEPKTQEELNSPFLTGTACGLLAAAILGLGIYPQPIFSLARSVVLLLGQ